MGRRQGCAVARSVDTLSAACADRRARRGCGAGDGTFSSGHTDDAVAGIAPEADGRADRANGHASASTVTLAKAAVQERQGNRRMTCHGLRGGCGCARVRRSGDAPSGSRPVGPARHSPERCGRQVGGAPMSAARTVNPGYRREADPHGLQRYPRPSQAPDRLAAAEAPSALPAAGGPCPHNLQLPSMIAATFEGEKLETFSQGLGEGGSWWKRERRRSW